MNIIKALYWWRSFYFSCLTVIMAYMEKCSFAFM